MLNGWRVLDLTDHRGEVGPYLLADLGAEVIKVEPAGGCPSRVRGEGEIPFIAYNGNKLLETLTGESGPDRARLLELIATCDLVFESGPPGRLAELGLSHDVVVEANDQLVHVIVTPFGLDGPRAHQPASELTIGALGGSVRLQGSPDRPPVQMSVPQVWRHAGAEAAIAALVGHRRMTETGRPQLVDVSAQSVMTWTMLNAMEAFEVQGRDFERTGSELHLSLAIQLRHETADGYTICVPTARIVVHVIGWLIDEGIVDAAWGDVDWTTYDHRAIGGEEVWPSLPQVFEAVDELCRRYPKYELLLRGLDHGATFAPLNTLPDLLGFDHLEARGFWSPVSTGDGTSLRAPGAFHRINGERPTVTRRLLPPPGTTPDTGGGSGTPGHAGADRRPAGSRGDPGPTSVTAPPTANGEPGLPFEGLKVVDFSWIGVGPITAKALADHGATVVRVESEGRIDGLRLQPPHAGAEPGINRSNFFGTFNTSKLGLSLDLKSEAGLAVARKLAAWADVVVESFTPGTVDRLGLGYRELAARNPGLIMVSTSLLGAGSPVSSMAGYGYHAAAIAGFQDLVGWPDRPPDGPWLAYTDTIGPRFITPALLAAIDHRLRTGEGCHLEAAQLEIALQLLAPELLQYQLDGRRLVRRGNREPGIVPQGVYPTRGDDQWLAISIVDDRAWEAFVGALGAPAWATDPTLATVAGRAERHDDIDDRLAPWTAGWDGAELERLLADRGIAAGVVQGSRQLLTDPQYLHRGFYARLEHTEVGVMPYAGHQYRIRGYDHGPRTAAPCLGEHSFEILTELLGLSVDEVAETAGTGALS
jgi:crotonobetainyl-CoA:carnitine CoA-transferase CaiB-like acyl-CoA transferase